MGLYVPKVAPLSPLPVREDDKTLLLPGCVTAEVGSGCPPPCVPIFLRDLPIWGMLCVDYGPHFSRGSPIWGKACGWEGVLRNSWRMGARPVGLLILPPPPGAWGGWTLSQIQPGVPPCGGGVNMQVGVDP